MGSRSELQAVVEAALDGVLADPAAAQVAARRKRGDKGRFTVDLVLGAEDRAAFEAEDGLMLGAVTRLLDAAAYKRHKRASLRLVDAVEPEGDDEDAED